MSVIRVMDSNLSNKIAAGEVVERLMNVVKELVENSIDAKATEIKIDLIESGIKEIKVTDNGCGMDKEDIMNCLLRHATSKIYDDDDLFDIGTLGFRGEAIPSIASVSKMEITSSMGDVGTKIYVEAGEIVKVENADARRGTIIKVSNIFYNTPARLKYLKSLYSELANIIDYVDKMALSFPNIKFVLTNDDKNLLTTEGKGNLLKVINNIYGLKVASKMLPFKASNDNYEIEGYLSYPEVNRSSRNGITILVNNRVIKNYDLNKSIMESYHTYLFKDKYPIVVLNIKADSSLIDVNVHPTKMDVKFSMIDSLKDLIFKTFSSVLEKPTLIPKYEEKNTPVNNKVDFVDNSIKIEDVHMEDIKLDFSENEVSYEPTERLFEVSEDLPSYEEPKEKFVMINPLALVHGTYIIGENETGMYIIDQHAANERINYEYYLKEMGKETNDFVDLLIPIKMELSNVEYLKLKEHFDVFKTLNIGIEDFGNNTVIIRSHPCYLKKDYVEESLRRIIEVVLEMGEFSKEKFVESAAITLACKMSIKANDHISMEEMKTLIERLRETKNPFTCPHGRPTIISFTKYELEKMFKRVE